MSKALTYEFEVPLEGYAIVQVEADSEEEARSLLADGYIDSEEVTHWFEDAYLLAVMDEDGEEV